VREARKLRISKHDKLTLEDTTHTIAEWAEFAGLPVKTLCTRIRAGWSVQRAIAAPLDQTCAVRPTPKERYERQRARRLRLTPKCPHCGTPLR
jgi:hypothetical protein